MGGDPVRKGVAARRGLVLRGVAGRGKAKAWELDISINCPFEAGERCTQGVMARLGAARRGVTGRGEARQGLSIQRIASTGCYAVVIPPVKARKCEQGRGNAWRDGPRQGKGDEHHGKRLH